MLPRPEKIDHAYNLAIENESIIVITQPQERQGKTHVQEPYKPKDKSDDKKPDVSPDTEFSDKLEWYMKEIDAFAKKADKLRD